jgi:RimJ/RimL family protein N-acetyltransferase
MYIELKTERLLLRPLDVSDFRTEYEYSSDIDTTKYMIYSRNGMEETYSCDIINA